MNQLELVVATLIAYMKYCDDVLLGPDRNRGWAIYAITMTHRIV